jgi:hypothetical protein
MRKKRSSLLRDNYRYHYQGSIYILPIGDNVDDGEKNYQLIPNGTKGYSKKIITFIIDNLAPSDNGTDNNLKFVRDKRF